MRYISRSTVFKRNTNACTICMSMSAFRRALVCEKPTSVKDGESHIRITCPCDLYPLAPHFYIVKLGVTGVYIFFLIFALKHRLSVLVRTCTHNQCFEQK